MKNDEKKPTFEQLAKTLLLLGIPSNSVAYDYALTAVPFVTERRGYMEIYRLVGEVHGVAWTAVERALRVACERSVNRAGLGTIEELYGNSLKLDGSPTVSQMLATAARLWFGMLPYCRT